MLRPPESPLNRMAQISVAAAVIALLAKSPRAHATEPSNAFDLQTGTERVGVDDETVKICEETRLVLDESFKKWVWALKVSLAVAAGLGGLAGEDEEGAFGLGYNQSAPLAFAPPVLDSASTLNGLLVQTNPDGLSERCIPKLPKMDEFVESAPLPVCENSGDASGVPHPSLCTAPLESDLTQIEGPNEPVLALTATTPKEVFTFTTEGDRLAEADVVHFHPGIVGGALFHAPSEGRLDESAEPGQESVVAVGSESSPRPPQEQGTY